MESYVLLTAYLSLFVWLYLVLLHGRFWRADQVLEENQPQPPAWPDVVALVPAVDGAPLLRESLDSLLTQDYPGRLRVIVIADDNGATADLVERVTLRRGTRDRVEVIGAGEPPKDWSAKSWALAAGRSRALETIPDAVFLWLSDPDIVHWSSALRLLVAKSEDEQLDLVSLVPLLPCDSPWERLLIPAFLFLFQERAPFRWSNDPRRPTAAAARGCNLVRAEASDVAGGFAAIKDNPSLETALATQIKHVAQHRGHGIWLGLGEEAVSAHEHAGPMAIWRLVARDAFVHAHGSALRSASMLASLALTYLIPPLSFAWAFYAGFFLDIGNYLSGFLAMVGGCAAWGLMALAAWPTFNIYRQPEWMTLLLPLAVLFYALMTLASAVGLDALLAPRRVRPAEEPRLSGFKGAT